MNILPDDKDDGGCEDAVGVVRPHDWVIVCSACGAYGYHQDVALVPDVSDGTEAG